MIAAIPYTTFPEIELGPIGLRTFGLMVGIGVVVGAWLAARLIERSGIPRDETYRIATRLVVAGVIGARLTWVVSHWSDIDSLVDIVAVWEGGLQFSGGFVAAVLVGYPDFRRWSRTLRWRSIDGYAYGLTLGLAFGRIGCYSVGEHFGSTTTFFLGTTYEGGSTREDVLGSEPLTVGTTFHNTALYEFVYLLVIFAVLSWLVRRRSMPGTLIGTFCLLYGVARFSSDFLRVNDETVLGLTGAQYLMVALVGASVWILWRVRPSLVAEGDATEPGESDERTGSSGAGTSEEVVDDVQADRGP